MAEKESPPKVVPVVTPSGKVGYLPAEFAADADEAGLRPASKAQMLNAQVSADEAARDDALRAQFENGDMLKVLEGQVAPQAAGLARGLTFGLSDVGLKAIGAIAGGDEGAHAVSQRLADYQDYSPFRSTAGEIGGAVLPALMGDEAGLLKLTPAGLASGAGRAIEEGITSGIGAESGMARVASRIIGHAAAGAAENSLYEVGKVASDAAIHDEPLTAEKLVAGAKHGAILGGGLGAALGGVSSAFRAASDNAALRTGEDVLGGVRPASEATVSKGTIGDYIAKTADVKTIKALGGSAGDLRALENNVEGGFRRVARDIRADVEATTGKSFGLHSRSSLNDYAIARRGELGDKLGGMLERLDEGGTGIAPNPQRLDALVREKLITPNLIKTGENTFVPLPGQEKVVSAVEGWLGRIETAFSERPPTFSEWHKIRVGLDKEINYAAAKVSPKTEALRSLRGFIEDELIKSGEAAASSMGSSFQAEYKATKSLYQSVKKAEELTTRGVSRDLANNSFGLTSRMAGIAGASVGGMAGGLLASLAGKVVQSHGDQMAADLLSRAASLGAVNRLAGKVTGELNSGVSKLLGEGTKAAGRVAETGARVAADKPRTSQRERFEQTSDALAKASVNPAAVADHVERSLGALPQHAPGTADEVVTTMLRGLDFLHGKLPPSRQDPYSLQPLLQPRTRASDSEISRFMRYSEAVDDPLIVLREAKSGTLTRDHVKAVQAVYPKLYDEIRGAVFRSLVESKSEVPYQRRIQLGILLNIPTDKTLSPEFREAIQATYSSADQAGAESPPRTSAAPEIAASFQTATERATERAQ